MFEVWQKFKDLLRQCPHHGIHVSVQMETFYNELVPSTRLMVDATSSGALLNKSYQKCYDLVESTVTNNYQFPNERMQALYKTTTYNRDIGYYLKKQLWLHKLTHMVNN